MKRFLVPVCLALWVAFIATQTFRPASAKPLTSYPADPTQDIAWSAGTSTVTDIQTAFNYARTQENAQLGKSIPAMTLPAQSIWNGMSDGNKASWLINRERIDRGVLPMHGSETNVTSVAQSYANYLIANNAFSHNADGQWPWDRMRANSTINACSDGLFMEDLAAFMTSGNSISLPVERSIYVWIYTDASSNWGHRHTILYYPYNDNSGAVGDEGFMGIGRAHGGPYQGPFSQSWNFAEIIVMDFFDPCATWVYPTLTPRVYLPIIIR